MSMLQRKASIKEAQDVQEMSGRIKESYRQVEVAKGEWQRRESAYEKGINYDEDEEIEDENVEWD